MVVLCQPFLFSFFNIIVLRNCIDGNSASDLMKAAANFVGEFNQVHRDVLVCCFIGFIFTLSVISDKMLGGLDTLLELRNCIEWHRRATNRQNNV